MDICEFWLICVRWKDGGLGMGFGILGSSISRSNYEWTLEGMIEQVAFRSEEIPCL